MTTEFGHHAVIAGGLCIDSWGSGPFLIRDASGKVWRFEDSDRFGPYIVLRNGREAKNLPPERSPFWRAHYLWCRQGRQLNGAYCVWREPKPTIYRTEKRGRSNFIVVLEAGEPDGRQVWENGTRLRLHPDDCSGGPR